MIIEELVTHLGIDVDSSDLKGFKSQLTGAVAVMGGLAAAGAAVVSVIGEVLQTAGQDAELKLFADGIRDSFEAIQELESVASQFDVTSGKLRGTLSSLRAAIDGALSGDDGNLEALGMLGLSSGLRDENGNPIRPSELLKRIADVASTGADSPLIRNFLDGIGIGPDMLPFLEQGSDGIERLVAEMRELGALRTNEQSEAALRYAQSLDKVKASLSGLAFDVGEPALAWAQSMLDSFLAWRKTEGAQQLIDQMSDRFAALGKVGESVAGVFDAINGLFEAITPLIQTALGPLEPFVDRWLEWVGSFGPLRTMLGTIESAARGLTSLVTGEGFAADLIGSAGLPRTAIQDALRAGAAGYGGFAGAVSSGFGSPNIKMDQKVDVHVQGDGRDVVREINHSRDEGMREAITRMLSSGIE